MNLTRRDLSLLLPALLSAARVEGQQKEVLSSKCFDFAQLPVKTNKETGTEVRQVFDGTTHEGFPIDLHITRLPPGQMPHPAHHHVHEEMMFIQEGTLEMTIKGESSRLGPGSVVYVNSNDEHGLKNPGTVPVQYFVLAIGHRAA